MTIVVQLHGDRHALLKQGFLQLVRHILHPNDTYSLPKCYMYRHAAMLTNSSPNAAQTISINYYQKKSISFSPKYTQNTSFAAKKKPKVCTVSQKAVPLHRNWEREVLDSKAETSLGIWCNGNTTDSGPVFPGSSPGIPTRKRLPTKSLFLLFTISYSGAATQHLNAVTQQRVSHGTQPAIVHFMQPATVHFMGQRIFPVGETWLIMRKVLTQHAVGVRIGHRHAQCRLQ